MPNGLKSRLAFHFLNELLLRLVGRDPRNALQSLAMLLLDSSTSRFLDQQFLLPLRQFQVSPLGLAIPLLNRTNSLLDGLVPIKQSLFHIRELGQLDLLLLLQFLFRPKQKVFGLQLCFLDDILRLPLSVLYNLAGLLLFLGLLSNARYAT